MNDGLASAGALVMLFAGGLALLAAFVEGVARLCLWVDTLSITYQAPYSGPVMTLLALAAAFLAGALLFVAGSWDGDEGGEK